jgi:hypothetical protein
MGRFETKWLAAPDNLSALAELSGQWIDRVHGRRPPRGIVLDMDFPVAGLAHLCPKTRRRSKDIIAGQQRPLRRKRTLYPIKATFLRVLTVPLLVRAMRIVKASPAATRRLLLSRS